MRASSPKSVTLSTGLCASDGSVGRAATGHTTFVKSLGR